MGRPFGLRERAAGFKIKVTAEGFQRPSDRLYGDAYMVRASAVKAFRESGSR